MLAMDNTYVVNERNVPDIEQFMIHLNHVRALLSVQFEKVEEEILKTSLWHLINNRIFFQHPDMMRMLRIHENVMTVMMNILGTSVHVEEDTEVVAESGEPKAESKDTSELVVACCKFLCCFCRSSRQNQKAMFEHLVHLSLNI